MAEEDEIDIEGDFDFKINSEAETSNIYDLNEPPSKTANLQPEFSQHPWVLEQGWSLDQVTDEKSKAVIEKMLLEEQQYSYKLHAKQATSTLPKPKAKPTQQSRKFWSEEEKQLFLKGFLSWGRRWSRIADLIPGRSVQQVKNYGLQYLKSNEKKNSEKTGATSSTASIPESLETSIALVTTGQPTTKLPPSSKASKAQSGEQIKKLSADAMSATMVTPVKQSRGKTSMSVLVNTSEVVRIRAAEAASGDEDEEVDIEDDASADAEDDHVYRSLVAEAGIAPDVEDSEIEQSEDSSQSCKSDTNDGMSHSQAATSTPAAAAEEQHEASRDDVDTTHNTYHSEDSVDPNCSSDDDSEHDNEYWIVTSSGDLKYFPNPTEERMLHRDDISDEERVVHSEFFDGRSSSKNAERYLKIRNHILDSWTKNKPNYLNKTVVRVGLKNCGDVNCIGRIHAYLEQIGAINYGCEQCQYNRPVKGNRIRKRSFNKSAHLPRLSDIIPRKRRVRDFDGTWIDEKDLQGKTIEHGKYSKDTLVKKVKVRRGPRDPFKLVPCMNFTKEKPKPFEVIVEASVLVLMDVHAHQCKTEVIGMLGGQFSEEQGSLHITMAQPCDSLSTHLQCEMDPVSQAQSCMHIMAQGYSVVGWYHSHPTFTPDPSIRDIETQSKYQAWFAQGGSPFIGIIVSPYNSMRLNPSLHSQVRCLTITKNTEEETGDPYQFEYEVSQERWSSEDLLSEIRSVVEKYSSDCNRVNLLNRYRSNNNVTCLQKLLESVGRVVPLVEDERDTFLMQLSSVIEEHYTESRMDGDNGGQDELADNMHECMTQLQPSKDLQSHHTATQEHSHANNQHSNDTRKVMHHNCKGAQKLNKDSSVHNVLSPKQEHDNIPLILDQYVDTGQHT